MEASPVVEFAGEAATVRLMRGSVAAAHRKKTPAPPSQTGRADYGGCVPDQKGLFSQSTQRL